jgi:uncharacterized protein (TIGR00369 family)
VATPDLERRVRDAVAKQPFMSLLGVRVVHVAPGEVDLAFAFDERLTQQHGFLHAGVVAAVVDSACGYAAYSAGEGEIDVLTVEFKINLLEPAVGAKFVARGRVVRMGRRLSVCRGEVVAVDGEEERPIAVTTTTMALRSRPS